MSGDTVINITFRHLSQVKELVENLSDTQLSTSIIALNGMTIGAHIRHVLEFYLCLLEGTNSKCVNYDKRKRDKSIEVSTRRCISIINHLLTTIQKHGEDFEMTLTANYGSDDCQLVVHVKSTFFRELLANVEHITHHLAIIRIGIQSFDANINITDDLGIAASTLRNKKLCVQ